MSTAYVVTIGGRPQAAATTLATAQADAEQRETRYEYPGREFRWDRLREDQWQLMSRIGPNGQFAPTGRAVRTVPLLNTPGGDAR